MFAFPGKQRRETTAMQYLVPTPKGEQPELQLAYLVVDGQLIPASQESPPTTLNIVTVEQGSSQSSARDETEAKP
jgi:hypothetical protein